MACTYTHTQIPYFECSTYTTCNAYITSSTNIACLTCITGNPPHILYIPHILCLGTSSHQIGVYNIGLHFIALRAWTHTRTYTHPNMFFIYNFSLHPYQKNNAACTIVATASCRLYLLIICSCRDAHAPMQKCFLYRIWMMHKQIRHMLGICDM